VYRCPNALVAEADVLDLIEAVQIFRAHGILPVAAGWLDQAHVFVQALRIVEGELAEVRAKKRGG
jgi:hypothetical protein